MLVDAPFSDVTGGAQATTGSQSSPRALDAGQISSGKPRRFQCSANCPSFNTRLSRAPKACSPPWATLPPGNLGVAVLVRRRACMRALGSCMRAYVRGLNGRTWL